ncbi:D-glycero-beta-D-manno-heptose 1,7-bisphosphate 7-phosphatase [Geomonas subterranea]|uniref:D,D-heptose 1,7-bisphosphate phosphatase n=1 Tax=Geomonas subterranea TaxID=2847989 RepID=A0ABX8LMU1_9BACT|nr:MULTISPECIES: D-glycero-beta-D-manno-heptose 1,7-bisphosphate 7-phosphatase [Geomonas]QXE92247.1 D-glycero-beta-D-manno-heptose 1,7-bisphosphate 7-phosphatase [Geomonas subterranea]QXM09653.1 D-glycero-beta-D-manno-heptose 1,7-bisphosphate 7-phosphatase [Geomonas subterranea]
MGKQRAVFLDRDGTINEEVQYLSRVEDFRLIPGVPYALQRLKDAGFLLVVVTNQSGVGRGLYDETALQAVHDRMHEELGVFGITIDACYFCPHHPEHAVGHYRVECSCRKPSPGMLEQAAVDLDIDLSRSYMIGDKLGDIEAGLNAGCTSLMVLTGYGAVESARLPKGVRAYEDLQAAVEAIFVAEAKGKRKRR